MRFTGPVQNISDYLQASDLFVFPTENDAFPSSVVEAMACGLPVISTPVGAIKTIITHDENGLLIQPSNHDQLLNALELLKSNRELATRLGENARLSVQSRYSAQGVTRKYLSLFQSILDARKFKEATKS